MTDFSFRLPLLSLLLGWPLELWLYDLFYEMPLGRLELQRQDFSKHCNQVLLAVLKRGLKIL